jgi:PAS domain S-box-containing protein
VPVNVLVVDDYEPFRRCVCSIVRAQTNFVLAGEARDGMEAIRLAEALQPDLIVLDIGLPKMNGIEAARVIRTNVPQAKIVFLTQDPSAEVARVAFGTGASAYVIKTYAHEELPAALETVADNRQFFSSGLPKDFSVSPNPAMAAAEPVSRGTPDSALMFDIEALGVPAAELGSDCTLRRWNHQLRQLLGYSPGEIPRFPFDQVFRSQTGENDELAWKRLKKGEVSSSFTERLATRKDGTTFPVRISLSAARDQSNSRHFVGVLAIVDDITPLRTARKDLLEAETARRDLASRLVNDLENERTRIGRELHDDICQSLALLAIQFRRAGQPVSGMPGRQHAGNAELCDKLRDVTARISRLSHQLHSSHIEYLGLAASVQGHCREFSEEHHINVDFTSTDVPRKLKGLLAVSLLRIVQEALHNVSRHSCAKSARVALRASPGHLCLTIEDDGIGFDIEEARLAPGLGLISMRERVCLAGGTFRISSTAGKGTRIVAEVPFSEQEEPVGEPVIQS